MKLKLTLFLSTYLVSCRSIPTSEPSHKLNDPTLAAETYKWIKAATTVIADRGSKVNRPAQYSLTAKSLPIAPDDSDLSFVIIAKNPTLPIDFTC